MFQLVSAAVIIILNVIDRITKYEAVLNLKNGSVFDLIPGFIRFRYVENTGAAFSSFSGSTLLLTVVTFIIIVGCAAVLFSKRIKSLFCNVCLILMIAGGIGNEIDRIIYGYVVDFIEPVFVNFAVFNFADCCITVGALMLIIYEICDLIRSGKKEKNNA